MGAIKVIAIFFEERLSSMIKGTYCVNQESNEIARKILDWLDPVVGMIQEKIALTIEKGLGGALEKYELPPFKDKIQRSLWILYKNTVEPSKFIIELLADPNLDAKSKKAREVFELFCSDDCVGILKFLISRGFEVKKFFDSEAGLLVIREGNLKVFKFLIESGAEIEAREFSLMMVCIKFKKHEFAEYLISKGAKIHIGDIAYAARKGESEILKLLVSSMLSSDFDNLTSHDLLCLVYAYQDAKPRINDQELIKRVIKKFVPNWDPNKRFEF